MKTISPYFTENILNYDILHAPLNSPDHFSVYFSDQANSYFSIAVYTFPFSVKKDIKNLNNFLVFVLIMSLTSILLIGSHSLSERILLLFIVIPLEIASGTFLKQRKKEKALEQIIQFHSPLWASHFVIVDQKLRQPFNLEERQPLLDQIMLSLGFTDNPESLDIKVICKVGIMRSSGKELETLLRNRAKLAFPGIYFEEYFNNYFGLFAFGDWSGVAPVVVSDDFSIHPLIPPRYLYYPLEQHPHYVSIERAFSGFFLKLYSDFPHLHKNDGYYHFVTDAKNQRKPKPEDVRGVFTPQCVIASSGHRGTILRLLKGKK